MLKLDLGCGNSKTEGFVGINIVPGNGVDVIHDIDKGLPYSDNEVDYIKAHYLFEHLINPQFVMGECWRVLKMGGGLELILPHFSNHLTWAIGHNTYYSYYGIVFSMITQPKGGIWERDYRGKFELLKGKINVFTSKYVPYTYFFKILAYFFPVYYEKYFCFISPANNFELVFRKIR